MGGAHRGLVRTGLFERGGQPGGSALGTGLSERPEDLLASLLDNLGARRIEIDMVEFSGAAFQDVDHRVMSLRLVEFGLSQAAMFSASGEVLRPSEVLYKRPVILQRGRFSPPTKVHSDIQRRAL